MTLKAYITIQEVQNRLGISERHVYNLLKAGLLQAIDISVSGKGINGKACPQSLRISVESVLAFRRSRVIDPEKYYE